MKLGENEKQPQNNGKFTIMLQFPLVKLWDPLLIGQKVTP